MLVHIKDFNIRSIANSGQCFRIYEIDQNVFNVQTVDKFLRINKISDEVYDFDCSKSEFIFYKHYFDLNVNYKKYQSVCKSNDSFLKNGIYYSKGLKILNQDKFETIISFIISQRKSIKAIQTSIERLCKMAGNKHKNKYGIYYTFPTARQILSLGKVGLKKCGLGYRVEYIANFCMDYINKKFNFAKMEKMSDEELIHDLMKIKGVGIKVASCIALFSFHRLSVCPKDVWINRIIETKYKGKIPKEYKDYMGVIQQYWFNYIINNKNKINGN